MPKKKKIKKSKSLNKKKVKVLKSELKSAEKKSTIPNNE